jgi:hypothetical protein
VRIAVLNGCTALGIPVTKAVGSTRLGKGETCPSPDSCNRVGLLTDRYNVGFATLIQSGIFLEKMVISCLVR